VDNDPLTFSWSMLWRQGNTAVLDDPTSKTPTFVAERAGNYIVQLIVNDGKVPSEAKTVKITANSRPVAIPQAPQQVMQGDTVTLDGSQSYDPDGDSITYQWSLSKPNASTAALSDATAMNSVFVADVPGTYSATLVVNDGKENSDAKTVPTEAAPYKPPIVNAGPDQTIPYLQCCWRLLSPPDCIRHAVDW
jgi:hypothetical protein